MNRKRILWTIVSIIGIIVIGVGIYAYQSYSKTSDILEKAYAPLNRDKSPQRGNEVSIEKADPISVLFIGADEREDEGGGRSDTLILLTLNPETKSTKMVSIPRDTYTEIVGKGTMDKINHAYAFGGIDMTVQTVENFLNVPIDYYIELNMKGFRGIVDAVGGVDVVNDLDFTYQNIHFAEGPIHLDGREALVYSRMRKQDPRGDFGRQMRQRQVIRNIVEKGAAVESREALGDILGVINQHVKTNLKQDEMLNMKDVYGICRENMEEIQIEGKGGKASDGIWYYQVSDETRQQLSQKLREHLEI